MVYKGYQNMAVDLLTIKNLGPSLILCKNTMLLTYLYLFKWDIFGGLNQPSSLFCLSSLGLQGQGAIPIVMEQSKRYTVDRLPVCRRAST